MTRGTQRGPRERQDPRSCRFDRAELALHAGIVRIEPAEARTGGGAVSAPGDSPPGRPASSRPAKARKGGAVRSDRWETSGLSACLELGQATEEGACGASAREG